jgi:hypothetical protein
VCDQQQRGVLADALEQVQNLCLYRDVERGRRFVGNKQVRCRGNHYPLSHSAGKLVRISAKLACGIGQTYPVEHVHDALVCLPTVARAVPEQNTPELFADRHIGVPESCRAAARPRRRSLYRRSECCRRLPHWPAADP